MEYISKIFIKQGPNLSAEDVSFLSSPIDNLLGMDHEVLYFILVMIRALFHIGDEKAPGLDGFTIAFFKKNWDLIKGEFSSCCS